MKTYLTVGTDLIKRDLFRKVQNSSNTDTVKPSGGLWLTDFNINYPNYNSWVDYILNYNYILFYKNKEINPFIQPCSVVSLKEDASIFYLTDLKQYNFLVRAYGNGKDFINFEKLAEYYDGIYIDLSSLRRDLPIEQLKLLLNFSLNTLLLFNLDCIDYYYAGKVKIDEFDYTDIYINGFINYEINWDSSKKYIDDNTNFKKLVKKRMKED